MGDPLQILALDQGTTSTRALVFDSAGRTLALSRRELTQHYPAAGWVEHDPEDIWRDTLTVISEVLQQPGVQADALDCVGITNQRETTVLWERASGRPVYPAIVWQDRRTAQECARLRAAGCEALVRQRTGLLLDPYFSGTKLAWLLDNVPGARERAMRGELAFGTVDSFLMWRLGGGRPHATDVTNASRTLLFDIHRQQWDPDLLALLRIPPQVLPEVRASSGVFGFTDPRLVGRALPICGVAGDQQAALVGQACFTPGMIKATYGTGAFLLLNTGQTAVPSRNRLLTTPAYRLAHAGSYALEGSIFIAGAAIKWLRDSLQVLGSAHESAALAAQVPADHGLYLVPAFVGLGAPHWDPEARGLLTGLTLTTSRAHLVRAVLEAVAYQSLDLIEAMSADGAQPPAAIRVDGGMAANDWLCQFLADILNTRVERPAQIETTALGAAFLAGLATGLWPDLAAVSATWERSALFTPRMADAQREHLVGGWRAALRRTLQRPAAAAAAAR